MNVARTLNYSFSFFSKIFLFGIFLLLPRLVTAQVDKEFWFAAPYIDGEGRDFDKPIIVRITTLSSAATGTRAAAGARTATT